MLLRTFASVLAVNLVLGWPTYLICFMFSYYEATGLANHLAFLALIATFAVICGLLSAPFSGRSAGPGQRAAVGVLSSLALNAAVLGAGSIISAAHKDQQSVSVDFSRTTDVLVATGLFLTCAVCAVAAHRTQQGGRRAVHWSA